MTMLTDPAKKYLPFKPVDLADRSWPDATIFAPPIWCSVDMRDGNQALIEPMNLARKRKMFDLLVEIGFKEIEVGFPSSSDTEFEFVRSLIDENLIPDDVTIQVLTQARSRLVERTIESLVGARCAIVHVYNATSPVMRQVVFGLDKDGIVDIAVRHAQLIRDLTDNHPETDWRFQYSPEMFSGTEVEFSKEICDAVTETFGATPDNKLILNLPSTVECATPNRFADQIEWMHRHLNKRESVILSVHPHNDRGTGTASAELAMMAGVDRVEGCLFGNGERTGNVDIVNLAMNMYSQGVDPGLNFSDIDGIRRIVEHCNQLPVHPRHPYVGDLVYTSFAGSHQDAIKKAFDARRQGDIWDMPYLPIDPKDVGRSYEAVIRINSQSGKGGIAYLLQHEHGLDLPRRLQIEFSQVVQKVSEQGGHEISGAMIFDILHKEFLEDSGPLRYMSHLINEQTDGVRISVELNVDGETHHVSSAGNGPINAFVSALEAAALGKVAVLDYHEHALGAGAEASAVSYIELQFADGKAFYGIGLDSNIVTASIKAIVSGINRAKRHKRDRQRTAA